MSISVLSLFLFVSLNVHLLQLTRFLAVRDKAHFWFILNLTVQSGGGVFEYYHSINNNYVVQ